MNSNHRSQPATSLIEPAPRARSLPTNHRARAAVETGKPQAPGGGAVLDRFLQWLIALFSSLRLTVVCLCLGMILVFAGTLAQVELGLYKAQNEFFRSLFVYWTPKGASWKIPVLPGGYLVGGVLLINLVAAHLKRFSFTRKKAGIWLVHFGLILLLLGQILTDLLARESILHLREGETKNYSEATRQCEVAIVDTTDPGLDTVVAIPQVRLAAQKEIRNRELPFVLRVNRFIPNSVVERRAADAAGPPPATQDIGSQASLKELPRVTDMDHRDMPSAIVEVLAPQGSLGTWLLSEYIKGAQGFTLNSRSYELVLRPRRYYKPFSLHLQEFRFDRYPGTEIPKNFSSRVRLERPDAGEDREVLIYMNNPLRYGGETFYQADWDHEDEKGTVLQVVHNPSWLTPYLSCILVAVGLLVQFGSHLVGFALKRRTA